MRTKPSHSSASITLSPPKLRRSDTGNFNDMPEPPSSEVRYNERTGRPIRSTRGKRLSKDLVNIELVDIDGYLTDTEDYHAADEDGDESITYDDAPNCENIAAGIKHSKKGKDRARDLSPSLHPPSPGPSPTPIRSNTQACDVLNCSQVTPANLQEITPAADAPLQLVFNVPSGFQGPFVVKLDMASLMANVKSTISPTERQLLSSQGVQAGSSTQDEHSVFSSSLLIPAAHCVQHTTRLGFQCLAPELRNKVYRLLFVGGLVRLHDKRDLSRSSNFLRTCRQVYEEGRTVLYGENVFSLDRCGLQRGHYYDKAWSEIGYKDFERFLKIIGPKNISFIREMELLLTDGAPSAFPDSNYEARRFINDVHLRECLKMLAKHSQLEMMRLGFWGRRQVALWDLDFLSVVRTIKVEELFLERRFHDGESRTALDVRESLMAAMVKVKPKASKKDARK
ncbi:MAG: hypothetical protein M1812_004738 [Candelaria pacifica]|nr:MAG: hypothetical protein M1812_004738 [Candelaria pacifica]